MELARQCWDESRHVAGLSRRLSEMGGRKGEFPISAFEWCVTCAIDNLPGRLASQNRTFEAGALDVVGGNLQVWRDAGDDETADVLDAILADEVQHVRFANRWLKLLIASNKRTLLQIASAVRFVAHANAVLGAGGGGEEAVQRAQEQSARGGSRGERRRPAVGRVHRGRDSGDPAASRLPVPASGAIPGGARVSSRLDPALFGPEPARDPRFEVREVHAEMPDFPEGDARRVVEFLHRQMNEEVNGLEISARNLVDFPDAPWPLRLAMARQCADEARHVDMFRRCFEARGGRVGEFPVLNFQYRIIAKIDSLIGRLAVQNRSFEAVGLDAIQQEVETRSRSEGETDLAELFDAQLADEVQHVRYSNDWIPRLKTGRGSRALLDLARAVAIANEALRVVAGDAATFYPVAGEVRREAGFSDAEIEAARQLMGQLAAEAREP